MEYRCPDWGATALLHSTRLHNLMSLALGAAVKNQSRRSSSLRPQKSFRTQAWLIRFVSDSALVIERLLRLTLIAQKKDC
jgi:hypothetical protein